MNREAARETRRQAACTNGVVRKFFLSLRPSEDRGGLQFRLHGFWSFEIQKPLSGPLQTNQVPPFIGDAAGTTAFQAARVVP